MTKNRNHRIDILATGVSCSKCGAGADETCRTPNRAETLPHQVRIDRACKLYHR